MIKFLICQSLQANSRPYFFLLFWVESGAQVRQIIVQILFKFICTLLMSRKISILAVATSWMNPTILEAKCSSIEILAALKIVTVLKITVLTPVHCWNIIKLMEIPNGTTVFRENNSFPFSSTLVILFLKDIFLSEI